MNSINANRTIEQRGADRLKYLSSLTDSSQNKKKFNDFQKQKHLEELLMNSVAVSDIIKPEDMLVPKEKTQINTSTDPDVIDLTVETNKLLTNLQKIAEPDKAKLMVDNIDILLTDEQMKLANQLFPEILSKAKKQFAKGLEADAFVNFLVNYIIEYESNDIVGNEKQTVIKVKDEKKVNAIAMKQLMKSVKDENDHIARLERLIAALIAAELQKDNTYDAENDTFHNKTGRVLTTASRAIQRMRNELNDHIAELAKENSRLSALHTTPFKSQSKPKRTRIQPDQISPPVSPVPFLLPQTPTAGKGLQSEKKNQ